MLALACAQKNTKKKQKEGTEAERREGKWDPLGYAQQAKEAN